MRRPAKSPLPRVCSLRRRNRAAFLLIEAGLAAVAIAIGLVAITRGLGTSLSVLASLQRRDAFLAVADSTLQQLRVEAQAHPPLPFSRRRGTCESVSRGCEWALTFDAFTPTAFDVPSDALRLVTLTVRRNQESSGSVSLRMVWPGDWIGE